MYVYKLSIKFGTMNEMIKSENEKGNCNKINDFLLLN
jgi:hypothetical protein